MKKKTQIKVNELKTEIELVFDGHELKGAWYHPKIEKVLCSLCGKECKGLEKCASVNPWCG
jgi:hypothetical protein